MRYLLLLLFAASGSTQMEPVTAVLSDTQH